MSVMEPSNEKELIERALHDEAGRRELYEYAYTIALSAAAEHETKDHSRTELAKIAMVDFHKAFYAYIRRTLTEHGAEDRFKTYFSWWATQAIERHLQPKKDMPV